MESPRGFTVVVYKSEYSVCVMFIFTNDFACVILCRARVT